MTHFLPTGSGQEPAADIPFEYAVGVRARVTTPEGWPVAHPVITLTDRSGVQITRTVGEAHGEAAGPPVPAGTYTLIVTAPGYQPAARTVTLPARVIPFQPETMTLTRSGTAALPVHGVTHPVDLELSYSGVTRDPWGGIRAGFHATTSLRRHDFEIAFDERLLSGIAQIGSTVRIELDMQAVQGPTLPWRDLGLEI